MRRIKIIITAIFLAIIGAILPMAGALFFAWQLAFNAESKTLYEYSSRMLTRAKYTLNDARKALSLLQKQSTLPICSPKHIALMNKIATSIMEAKTISFFDKGIELCTSCGVSNPQLLRYKADFMLPDGLEIANIHSPADPKASWITLRQNGNYDVFVDSKRLSDIIVPKEVWLAIIYDGQILTEQNTIDAESVKIIMNQIKQGDLSKYYENANGKEYLKPAKDLKKYHVFLENKRMVSINQYGPFYFIASEPESFVYHSYKNMQFILLPFGLITVGFIIGLVIYFSYKRLSLKADLQEALKNNEFLVYYQPLMNTESGSCYGAEALVRWQRTNGPFIRPDLFISYAEEVGIISSITDRVIEIVFKEMEELLVQNKQLHISINVSSNDIQTGRILDVLEAKISKTKISRNQIWIELTERIFLEIEKAKNVLVQIHELGYGIAIDDFGTGFSNLSYLQNLPLDILKIDKSFIDSLGMNSVTSHVTGYIIKMAKDLNLKLVAEGVERQDQYDYLKEKKVDYIQGYLFAKPLSPNEFIRYLQILKQ